ncbi:MAG TPA: hypothetical protein HA223_04770 [Nanoarchaeota archaeon]|nr:hypothetical protein [Nanoarchaeota archaeon]
MELSARHYLGIGAAIILLLVDTFLFRDSRFFFFILGIVAVIAGLPFFVTLLIEMGREKEKEEMFLEFCRNLAEGVASGIPISKSIITVADKDYGSLTPHIRKLANQISLGIPFKKAITTFAQDTKNRIVKRSVHIIIEAEESGGEIGTTLDNVAKSVSEVEDIKKERRSIIYNQVVQGYMIFLMFIVIMLILQLWLLPKIAEVTELSGQVEFQSAVGGTQFLNNALFVLIMLQAIFTGLVIGQLSEGKLMPGIKHSIIMIVLSYLIVTAAHAIKAPVAGAG